MAVKKDPYNTYKSTRNCELLALISSWNRQVLDNLEGCEFYVKLCKEYLSLILLILLSINMGIWVFFGIFIQFLHQNTGSDVNTFLPCYIMSNKTSPVGDSDFWDLKMCNGVFVLQLTLWYIDSGSRSLPKEPLKISAFFHSYIYHLW